MLFVPLFLACFQLLWLRGTEIFWDVCESSCAVPSLQGQLQPGSHGVHGHGGGAEGAQPPGLPGAQDPRHPGTETATHQPLAACLP